MSKTAKLFFEDGSTHEYESVPDSVTEEEIKNAGLKKFGKNVTEIQIKGIPQEPEAVAGQEGMSGLAMGLKDPISGGAQLLERILPQPIVERVNALNQALAEYGLVSPLPEGGVSEMVRKEEAAYQAGRAARGEEGFDVSRLAGNVVNPANLAVGLRAGQLATKIPGLRTTLGQTLAAGTAPAALAPVTEGDFAEEKAKQIGLSAVAAPAGYVGLKYAGKFLNPLTKQAQKLMDDLGVQLTPGQRLGGQPKKLETFAENIPLVGSFITGAKERAIYQFNRGVINKALKDVNEELPEDVIGSPAVDYLNEVISEKYDEALKGALLTFDTKLARKIGQVIDNTKAVDAKSLNDLSKQLDRIVYSKIPVDESGKAVIDGAKFKAIEEDFNSQIVNYLQSGSPDDRQIGESLKQALKIWRAEFLSQNPKNAEALTAVNKAYGKVKIINNAATASSNGVFTPKQYTNAVRKEDPTTTAFARGKAREQDVAVSAEKVLGEEGTGALLGRQAERGAGRLGTFLLGTGAGGGGIMAYQTAPTLTTAVASGVAGLIGVGVPALYSKGGLTAMQAISRLSNKRPDFVRKIGKALEERATKEGSITGSMVMQEYRRATED